MKTFENKSFNSIRKEDGSSENYIGLLTLCLNTLPGDGFSIETMRKRFKVLERLESLELEDADMDEVKSAIKNMDGKWARLDKEILDFVDYFTNL